MVTGHPAETIRVLRVLDGTMETAFPASLATGIQARSFTVHLAR